MHRWAKCGVPGQWVKCGVPAQWAKGGVPGHSGDLLAALLIVQAQPNASLSWGMMTFAPSISCR